jgi:hypothetical protein
MSRVIPVRTITAVVILLLAAADAKAQWLGSIGGGVNVGGAVDQLYPRAALSLGRWRKRLAIELEAGVVPLFFESEPGDEIEMVVTIIPKVIVPIRPLSDAFTPFVSGGVGLISYTLTNSEDQFEHGRSHAAIRAGGGILKFMTGRWALRLDALYTRSLGKANPPTGFGWDHTTLDYWTVGGGLAVRF